MSKILFEGKKRKDKMCSSESKEPGPPASGLTVITRYNNDRPRIHICLDKLIINTAKDNLELQWPQWKTFNLDELVHLQNALGKNRS